MSSPIRPDPDAPERWSKALAEDDPLRGALHAAREERAPARRLDRVFAGVVAMSPAGAGGGELAGGADLADATGSGAAAASGAHAIGKTAVVGKVAAASVATSSGALAKAVVVGVFGAASVGTAWWIGDGTPTAAPTPSTVVKSAPEPVTSAVAKVVAERPRATEAAVTPSAAPSNITTSVAAASVAPPTTDDRSEATLLREASAAVANDPALAMQLLDEAERRFAGGALGQERELLRVQALIASGRRDEAVVRARKLLERNPSSAHRPRLEKMLPELAN